MVAAGVATDSCEPWQDGGDRDTEINGRLGWLTRASADMKGREVDGRPGIGPAKGVQPVVLYSAAFNAGRLKRRGDLCVKIWIGVLS